MKNIIPEVKLKKSLEEAFIHLKRLLYAGDNIKSFFPLREDFIISLDDEGVGHLDQFIYRFMKLQDCMSLRMFPALLENLQEEYKTRSFLDILNRLEQLGVIESAYVWQELRETRNNFAHEYPENTKENIMALNELYNKSADLLQCFRSAANYINANLKIDVPAVPEWPF
jgi:hypothetical protein